MPKISHFPGDYDWILIQFNEIDIKPVILAGQAVNLWGIHFQDWDSQYNPTSPKIKDLSPLTSYDLELLSIQGMSKLKSFSGIIGSEIADPFVKVSGPDIATFHLENERGQFKIQILAWLPGPDHEHIMKHLIPFEIGALQAQVRIPDPVILLACKIANLVLLDQKARHDLRHVQILMCCIRAFIGTFLKTMPARNLLKIIKRFDDVVQSRYAKKVAKAYALDWKKCIPTDLIEQAALTDKVWDAFLKHRRV